MVLLIMFPIGLLQTIASVNEGMWYARSAEFMQQPGMDTLRWLRATGDAIFARGLFAFVWFVFSMNSKNKVPLEEKTRGDSAPKQQKELEKVE